jgi:hypothetical protein
MPAEADRTLTPLDGRWRLRRTAGLVPPLGLLHKRIAGDRGATHLGAVLRLPFRVRFTTAGPELVYAGPLGFVRDRLTPDGEDAWTGEMLIAGRRAGRFRMTRSR